MMPKNTMPNLEKQVAFLMAVALGTIWLLGENSLAKSSSIHAESLRDPVGGGGVALAALVALMVLSGIFVAAETAVELLKSMHVRHYKDINQAKGDRLQTLLDGKDKYATACLLTSRIVRMLMVFVVLVLAQGFALSLEQNRQWTYNYGSILLAGLIIAAPVVLVNLIIGELVPKSYAAMRPHTVALALYGPIKAATFLLSLPANFIVALASLFTARFGGKAAFSTANQAEEEIKNLVESAERTGEIESDERELIHSVFEFRDTVAREIMTPRVELDAMPIKSDPNELVRVIQETGHSRIPLFEETDDQIVGIIHAKDLLMAMVEGPKITNLRTLMRPALFVPEGKDLHELLQEMRLSRSQMAIVQDEFGGTAGIVTIEDIVEQLVGEIVDEYDDEEPSFQQVATGWLVLGKAHLDDVNDEIGSEFESEEFDTIGGFIFGQFGRQPHLAEEISVDGYRFVVEETDGRRVLKLRIEKLPDDLSLENVEAS